MIETTKALVEQTHARIGYTQSDEISLVWLSDTFDNGIFFDGKVQKMCSVLAGIATVSFMRVLMNSDEEFYGYADKCPHFDCRVFQVPNKIEAANLFLWREIDCFKNAVSMAAHHYFSHKSLQGVKQEEMQERLFQEAGVNFNDYPESFKRGSWIRRVNVERTFTAEELARIPEKHRPAPETLITRSEMKSFTLPKFSTVSNRVEVIFDGAEPLLKE